MAKKMMCETCGVNVAEYVSTDLDGFDTNECEQCAYGELDFDEED